jgi:hypothetical protein
MKRNQIDIFEKLDVQLHGLHEEITALSKKTPNDAVNKFKLKLINKVLSDSNLLLSNKYRPFESFEAFVEEDMPSNSDVALVLLQYLNCMEKLRADNISEDYEEWYWIADKKQTNIRTSPPNKIK